MVIVILLLCVAIVCALSALTVAIITMLKFDKYKPNLNPDQLTAKQVIAWKDALDVEAYDPTDIDDVQITALKSMLAIPSLPLSVENGGTGNMATVATPLTFSGTVYVSVEGAGGGYARASGDSGGYSLYKVEDPNYHSAITQLHTSGTIQNLRIRLFDTSEAGIVIALATGVQADALDDVVEFTFEHVSPQIQAHYNHTPLELSSGENRVTVPVGTYIAFHVTDTSLNVTAGFHFSYEFIPAS